MQGTIVRAWKEGGKAHLAVRVEEAGGVLVEYIGALEEAELAGLTPAQQRAALLAEVKAVRATQVDGPLELPGFGRTVQL